MAKSGVRQKRTKKTDRNGKTGHVPVSEAPVAETVVWKRLDELRPSPENLKFYEPVLADDPAIIELAASIEKHGIKEPLVSSADGFLISGHRRYVAAGLAGLERVPCRVLDVYREDDIDAFVVLLREYNRQRVKNFGESMREAVFDVAADNEQEIYEALLKQRESASEVSVPTIELWTPRRRSVLSGAKRPMLDAIKAAIEGRRKFWPLSDRSIHYVLLNTAPLRHASKADSAYRNDSASYKDLTSVLTRARLEGLIPWEAIADSTRPLLLWRTHDNATAFLKKAVAEFGNGYWRNLMQSQPNHIEVIGEKNTIQPILQPICAKYTIVLMIGRGYCSIAPRHQLAERFRKSGKERLVLLFVTDHDPEGESIGESFARSMRDDFGIENIHPVKVALTAEQVERYKLPPLAIAKKGSSRAKGFTAKHGKYVHELEALPPEVLQQLLTEAIESVIDRKAINAEISFEKADAGRIQRVQTGVRRLLTEADFS